MVERTPAQPINCDARPANDNIPLKFGGLYDGACNALYDSQRFPMGASSPGMPEGPWPYSFAVWPHAGAWDGKPDRIWLVPVGIDLPAIWPIIQGELVAAVDRGRNVIIHGPDQEQLKRFGQMVVVMTGCAGQV